MVWKKQQAGAWQRQSCWKTARPRSATP